jgi:hypothetical protein
MNVLKYILSHFLLTLLDYLLRQLHILKTPVIIADCWNGEDKIIRTGKGAGDWEETLQNIR